MKYLKKHNIIILEDKDYKNTTREDLSATIWLMNRYFLKNEKKDVNFLIKVDLTSLFKVDKNYVMDLYDKSYLFGFDPEEIGEQLSIVCPNCFSNKFESIRKAYLPIDISADSFAIWEENKRELLLGDEIEIVCCKCGEIYKSPEE